MNHPLRKTRLLFVVSILTALTLVFAACDTNSNAGAGNEGVVVEDAGEVAPDGDIAEATEEAVQAADEPPAEATEEIAEAQADLAEETPEAEEAPAPAEDEAVEGEEVTATAEAPAEGEAVEGEVVAEEGEGVAAVQDVLVNASVLLGMGIDNVQDEDLGSLEDILIETSTGSIPYAIIGTGGFFGLGDEDVAVPFSAIELGETGNELIMPFTQESDLEGMPLIQDDAWPASGDAAWDDELFGYWSATEWGTNLGDFDETMPVVRASSLVGYGVGAYGDLGAGAVDSILVDMGTDQAKWIVLDYGTTGVATYADNLVLVPFSAMDWTQFGDEIVFRADLDPAALAGAPMILRDDFVNAEFLDPTFDDPVVDYWQGLGYEVE
jgi:hypothetical protein